MPGTRRFFRGAFPRLRAWYSRGGFGARAKAAGKGWDAASVLEHDGNVALEICTESG